MSPDDPRHGTGNGYTNLGCRCPSCADAFRPIRAAAVRALRARNKAKGLRGDGKPRKTDGFRVLRDR